MKLVNQLCLGALLAAMAAVGAGCRPAGTDSPVESHILKNGIRIVSVNIPKSTNVSIFTFLPIGLTTDEPGQAQWTHLVEHLVLRTTIPTNSMEANAETLPDHMRLDFYGHTGNWREGFSHHARWLKGIPLPRRVSQQRRDG